MVRRTRKTEIPKPLTEFDFVKSKITDYEASGREVTLGTLENGIWQEYQKGETWNTLLIGSIWEEKPEFVTIEELTRERRFYEEQFENRMVAIGVY